MDAVLGGTSRLGYTMPHDQTRPAYHHCVLMPPNECRPYQAVQGDSPGLVGDGAQLQRHACWLLSTLLAADTEQPRSVGRGIPVPRSNSCRATSRASVAPRCTRESVHPMGTSARPAGGRSYRIADFSLHTCTRTLMVFWRVDLLELDRMLTGAEAGLHWRRSPWTHERKCPLD